MGDLSTSVLRSQTGSLSAVGTLPIGASDLAAAIRIAADAATVVAAVRVAARTSGTGLWSQRVVVTGNGAAAPHAAAGVRRAMREAGMSPGEAARRVFWVGAGGLEVERPECARADAATPAEAMFGWAFRGARPTLAETVACAAATTLVAVGTAALPIEPAIVQGIRASETTPALIALGEGTPLVRDEQVRRAFGAEAMVFAPPPMRESWDGAAAVCRGVEVGLELVDVREVSDVIIGAAAGALVRVCDGTWPILRRPIHLRTTATAVAAEVVRAAMRFGLTEREDLRFAAIEEAVAQRMRAVRVLSDAEPRFVEDE